MITLRVNNSMSTISGLTTPQFTSLRQVLSYKMDASAAYFSGATNTTRYLLDKRGSFPTGLLYLVEAWAEKERTPLSLQDLRYPPRRSNIGLETFFVVPPPTPYPWQLEAARAASEQSRGIISAPTGSGKSLAIALICNEFRVRTLIVVPSLELKAQLTSSLQAWFGEHIVGPQSDQKIVTVENVDALDPNTLAPHDLIIVDEFHHAAAATYRKLNQKSWQGVYHRFGLTATAFRNQDSERLLLESVLSKTIYELTYTQARDQGLIVPVEAYYMDVKPMDPSLPSIPDRWANVYSNLVVRNEWRNDMIRSVLRKLHAAGESTLCLVKEIEHGMHISAQLEYPFVRGDNAPCVNSELIRRFNSGEIKTLIGTVGCLGEGVDTRPAEWIVIAGLGKARGQFLQQIGRGIRKNSCKKSCKVLIFKDSSHRWTLSHFNEQVKILKQYYGIKPVKLPMENIC